MKLSWYSDYHNIYEIIYKRKGDKMIKQNKKKFFKMFFIVVIVIVIVIGLISVNISDSLAKVQFYTKLKNNIKFIINVINASWSLLIILITLIMYILHRRKITFRLEKLNLGWLSITVDNPEKLFKQQVKNFLNTKRTIFKIEESRDDFYETLDSYHSVYIFLREEIEKFDSQLAKESECYIIANKMIKELNNFLTSHQNNFRRWYKYVIEKEIDKNYNENIQDIQKKYRNYELIIEDFKTLNNFFCSIAGKFEINIDKWYTSDPAVMQGKVLKFYICRKKLAKSKKQKKRFGACR